MISSEIPVQDLGSRIEHAVQKVVRGHDYLIRRVVCCMGAGGHLLLEDYPGTGKTTLSKAIAACIGQSQFQRIQFTPDLMPSDILGVSILDPRNGEFRFHQGPIFTNVLLADEINRASPRTQSALLEVMAEKQTTIEAVRHVFSGLYFVIATQNPVEFRGTYPLPEAQMDRFAMRCSLGYVDIEQEVEILNDQQSGHPLNKLEPVVTMDEVLAWMKAVQEVQVSPEIRHYIVSLCSASRHMKEVQLPASPRASLALMKVSQAMSLMEGRDFVTPEVVQDLASDVIAHRLVLDPDAKFSGKTAQNIVQDLLEAVPVPV